MDLDVHENKVVIAIDGLKSSKIAATLASQIAMSQHMSV